MFQALQHIDNALLLFINGGNNPFLDKLMWQISGRFTWIPMYLVFAFIIYREYKSDCWLIFLFAIIAIVISDQGANLVKNEVMRLRPSHTAGLSNLLHYVKSPNGEAYMGGDYGYVSNHAANAACFAMYMILLFKSRFLSIFLVCWVLLIGYSRIYLGVHYPSDVMGGMALGIVAGWLAYTLSMLFRRKSET